MTMTTHLLRAALLAGVTAFITTVSFAARIEDFRGDWTLLAKLSTGSTLSELHVGVNQAGDIEGTVKTMGEEAEITQFTMEGDDALMDFSLARGQQAINITLKLKVDGDSVSGQVKIGEQGIAIPVSGARMGSEGDMVIRMALAAEAQKSAGKPTLKFTEVGDFAGEWDMLVESESSGAVTVPFIVSDSGGMATALLKMTPPIGEQTINNIAKTDTGLDFRYEITIVSQTFKVIMKLVLKDGKIEGQIEDEGGVFSIPVSAVRKGQGASVAGSGASESQRAALSGRSSRARVGQKTARASVGGYKFELYYGELDVNSPGMNRIPFSQTEGYIWQPGKNGATKIKTEASLDFGGKVIPPGRYGIWTRRTKNGWNLIVNEYPDVWGTQHDPAADLAEVPMTVSTLVTPTDLLIVKIEEQDGAGVFKIQLGADQLAAQFKVLN